MNLSVRDLRAFLYVAELSSFTRAADRMHVTQAGISSMIRSLEQSLGYRLFERTPRLVTLTPSGKLLLPVAQQMLDELLAVQARMKALNTKHDSSIRIGATPLVCSSFLPSLCQELKIINPLVRIEVFELPFEVVPQAVEEGTVELGLCADVLQLGAVTRYPIASFYLMWVARPENASPGPIGRKACVGVGRPIRWADLPDLPLITLRSDDPMQRMVDKFLRKADRCKRAQISVGSVETQTAMVQAGIGGAIIPSFALDADACDLDVHPLIEPVASLDFCAFTRLGRELTGSMVKFLEIARTRLPPRIEMAFPSATSMNAV